MNTRTWQVGVVLTLLVSLIAVAGLSQGVAHKGLIPTPPESDELEVRIWVDKGAYAVGEELLVHYSVNKPVYVYIWDIEPDGTANAIFPSTLYPGGTENFVTAGEHAVPTSFTVVPPTGTEYLQILATTSPVDPFAFLTGDPEAFRQQVEVQILGLLPVTERSWNFTSFEIVYGPPPSYGTVTFTSTPSGAAITLDGTYLGYTPSTQFVTGGVHGTSFSKPGYQTQDTILLVIPGWTRTLHVTLVPLVSQNDPPTAVFAFYPTNPAIGDWVQFNAAGSYDLDGTITSYSWSFGDGTVDTGPTVWHRFTAGGAYPTTLTVTDDDGADDETTQVVQVGPTNAPPVAAFTYTPTNPLVGTWVQFDATGSFDSDGTVTSYSWNFGDGTVDTGPVVWHRFTTGGAFPVTLTAVDDDGASNSVTQTVQVLTTNMPPDAVFTYSPTAPAVAVWVRFDGSSSSDSDGSVVSYRWSFGDGTAPVSGRIAYHQFSAPGTYFVTLTVTDDDGATDTTSQPVAVGLAHQPPVASFTYTPLNPNVGQPVTLNGQSSYDPDGTIVTYLWDTNGDGIDDAVGPLVSKIYSSAGVITVRLTVIDNDSLSASATQAIVVGAPGGVPGAPAMGTTPGIFVWGTNTWHITVNPGPSWTVPRAYRLELETDGTFQDVARSTGGSVVPLGLVPTPIDDGQSLLFEGTVHASAVDYRFSAPGAEKIRMSLQLDIDGDGDLDQSSSFVYLRYFMVRPLWNPLVVGLPEGAAALTPSVDFLVGYYFEFLGGHVHVFTTSISQLEAQ
jgi:PKD repeat protein